MLLFTTNSGGLILLIILGTIVFAIAFCVYFLRMVLKTVFLGFARAGARKAVSVDDLGIQTTLLRLNYFKNLSGAGKEKFIKRVKQVVHRLEFSAEGNIEADDEKRVLIAAAAVQITFGLNEYDIDSIERIKIFADDIYNPRSKVRYKGLTFLDGKMFISWKHYLEGIKVQNDGIDLALHETAHGLYILLKQFRGYESLDETLNEWYQYAYPQIDHNNDGKEEFFRKYANANIQEFFAICIENFFERPAEFQQKLPLIYGRLCTFLNQDPRNKSDYEFVQQHVPMSGSADERFYLHKNRPHKAQGLLMWLSGASLVAILFLKSYFLETLFNLLLFSIPCMLISYNLFKKALLHTKRLSKEGYLLFCFTCINPIVFVMIMLLNLGVSSGIHGSKSFRVSGDADYFMGINQNDFTFAGGGKVYMLEDNSTVPVDLRMKAGESSIQTIEYKYHYGITGLKVFDSGEIKNE